MRKGRELLIKRHTPVTEDVVNLEKKLGFGLPARYREFILYFQQGENGLDLEREYKADINYHDILGPAVYSRNLKKEIIIDHFFEAEEILSTWESIDRHEITGKKDLIKIADLGSDPNGGLYVGIGSTNNEQIYRINWDMDDDNLFERITDHIFNFIEGMEQKKND